MRVVCVYNEIKDELAEKFGLSSVSPRSYRSISQGKEYVVLGLFYDPSLVACYGGRPVVEIKNDGDSLSAIPISFFEVTEPTPSRYWKMCYHDDGSLTFYPESFYQEFYHDDLSDGVPEVVEDFQEVCKRLESES